jgi:hypothetical protein
MTAVTRGSQANAARTGKRRQWRGWAGRSEISDAVGLQIEASSMVLRRFIEPTAQIKDQGHRT